MGMGGISDPLKSSSRIDCSLASLASLLESGRVIDDSADFTRSACARYEKDSPLWVWISCVCCASLFGLPFFYVFINSVTHPITLSHTCVLPCSL